MIPSKLRKDLAKIIKKYGNKRSDKVQYLMWRNIYLILFCNKFVVASKDFIHYKCLDQFITEEHLDSYIKDFSMKGTKDRTKLLTALGYVGS